MSLPAVATLSECTSFTQTVSPFLHQLSLPHLLPLLRREISPLDWYLHTNPLVTALFFALGLSVVVFVAAEVNRNYSQVDRLWSVLPTVYIAHFTVYAHLHPAALDTQRLDTLLTFAALWSGRLSFNYWRKGGYNIGSEDYRWEIIKKHTPAAVFVVFDLTFIAFYQNLLLLSVASPAYVLVVASQLPSLSSFSTADMIFSRGLMVLLILETLADQQQWSYQTAKSLYKRTGTVPAGYLKSDLDRGFVVTGLWSWSRHPNFLCEQAIWVGLYQWSCAVTDTVFNWTGIGAAAYVLLFQGSTKFTEWISSKKYPEYAEYQKRVGRFLPNLSASGGLGEETGEDIAAVNGKGDGEGERTGKEGQAGKNGKKEGKKRR